MTREQVGTTIENKALDNVVKQAEDKTRDYLCTDCLDKRCVSGIPCNAFALITKGYAWELAAEQAELN